MLDLAVAARLGAELVCHLVLVICICWKGREEDRDSDEIQVGGFERLGIDADKLGGKSRERQQRRSVLILSACLRLPRQVAFLP